MSSRKLLTGEFKKDRFYEKFFNDFFRNLDTLMSFTQAAPREYSEEKTFQKYSEKNNGKLSKIIYNFN